MHQITEPLRLAVGSHRAGSGKGCTMNVVSWANGDTEITDMPPCSDPMLSRLMQSVNDRICMHLDGDLLCSKCSGIVLDLGFQTVGTANTGLTDLELQQVYVRLAVLAALKVLHLAKDGKSLAAIKAAEKWAETSAAYASAACASAYASAASAAAYAACAAASSAASAASSAMAHAVLAQEIITEFKRLTGITLEPTPAPVIEKALHDMLTTS